MRLVLLFLLLLNLGFFAWAQYLEPANPGTDARPLARQIAPERLRIVPPGGKPLALAAPAAQPEPPAPRPEPIACLEWGSFTLADAPAAAKVIDSLGLGDRMQERRSVETAGWWVFIPPQSDGRAGAVRKARELRGLGVKDYFVVQDEGPNQWAVSLGVFSTEAAARSRLEALQKQKVRSAEVGQRETRVPKIWLQVREIDPSIRPQLETTVSRIPGTELRACPTG